MTVKPDGRKIFFLTKGFALPADMISAQGGQLSPWALCMTHHLVQAVGASGYVTDALPVFGTLPAIPETM